MCTERVEKNVKILHCTHFQQPLTYVFVDICREKDSSFETRNIKMWNHAKIYIRTMSALRKCPDSKETFHGEMSLLHSFSQPFITLLSLAIRRAYTVILNLSFGFRDTGDRNLLNSVAAFFVRHD